MRAFFFTVGFIFLLALPGAVSAASLSISPAGGSYAAGDRVTIRVLVSAPNESINAVSGTLSYSSSVFSVEGISKTGSILNFWPTEPSFSQNAGSVSFEGVSLSGYQGSGGVVIAVTLRATHAGSGTVSFSTGQVLLNDGEGTDVTSGLTGARFTINAVAPSVPATSQPAPAAQEGEDLIKPEPPALDPVGNITEGSVLEVTGKTYAAALVKVSVKKENEELGSQTVQAEKNGDFRLVWKERLLKGVYTLSAQVTDVWGGESDPSPEMVFNVKESVFSLIGQLAINYLSLIFIVLGVVASLLFAGWYLWHRFYAMHKRMRGKLGHTHTLLREQFNDLKDALAEEVAALEKIGSQRDLTIEEERFVNRFNKMLDKAERAIEKEIETTSK